MTIKSFEEIEAWQKARLLTKTIYALTSTSNFSKDYFLRDHVRKTAVSVLSNIAERFDRGGNKEFIQFLSIAKGSLAELKSQLYVAVDVGYLNSGEFENIANIIDQTGNLIGGFMRYLKNTKHAGPKYK